MAFFKFRFPGQAASVEAVTSGLNENIEVVRRRARHRLIGAVVLVLVAVIGFPLLFDAQLRLPAYAVDIENPAFIEAYGSTRLLVGELLSFFLACVGFVLYLRFAHKRPFLSIFTAAPHFRWSRGFGLGLILLIKVFLLNTQAFGLCGQKTKV